MLMPFFLFFSTEINKQTVMSVKSYIYSGKAIQHSVLKKLIQKEPSPLPAHSFSAMNLSQKKNPNDTLLALLHNAIAAQEVYPAISEELHQSGTVKIGFILKPNGELSDITLLQSSGFDSIDQAALDAAHAASPIHDVDHYLKNPEKTSLDILFKL